jgi:hypothetical protein
MIVAGGAGGRGRERDRRGQAQGQNQNVCGATTQKENRMSPEAFSGIFGRSLHRSSGTLGGGKKTP